MEKGNSEEHGRRSGLLEEVRGKKRGYYGRSSHKDSHRASNFFEDRAVTNSKSVKRKGYCKELIVSGFPEVQAAIDALIKNESSSAIYVDIDGDLTKVVVESSGCEDVEMTLNTKVCVIW